MVVSDTLPPYRDGTVLGAWGLAGRRGEINIHGMNTVVWDHTERGAVKLGRAVSRQLSEEHGPLIADS